MIALPVGSARRQIHATPARSVARPQGRPAPIAEAALPTARAAARTLSATTDHAWLALRARPARQQLNAPLQGLLRARRERSSAYRPGEPRGPFAAARARAAMECAPAPRDRPTGWARAAPAQVFPAAPPRSRSMPIHRQ